MKRKIFVCCSILPVKRFLEKRFGKHHVFLERHAALFKGEKDLDQLCDLLETENYNEIVFTQDLDCIFYRDLLLKNNELEFPEMDFLKEIYQDNIVEIENQNNISSKIGALYLAYLENIPVFLAENHHICERIASGQLELKGMLTQVQKEKSMEFKLNLAQEAI